MKYESPELTALTAIECIEFCSPSLKSCGGPGPLDSRFCNDVTHGYMDWEWD